MNGSLRVKAWILFQINKHTNVFYLQFTINVFQTYFLTSVNDAVFYDLQNFCKTCIAIHFRCTFLLSLLKMKPYMPNFYGPTLPNHPCQNFHTCHFLDPCQNFMGPSYPCHPCQNLTHATHEPMLPMPPPLFSRLFWSLSRLHSNSFFPLLLIIALLIRSWSFVPQNLPLQSFCSLGKRLCLSRWSQSFSEMIPVKIF